MSNFDRILVLGPIAVERDGKARPIKGRCNQMILGALVLSINHAVPIDRLADLIWADTHPAPSANALQAHISRLREIVGDEAIQAVDHSYLLQASCSQVDSCAFEAKVVEAAKLVTTDPATALSLLRLGLGSWRGVPYGELGDEEPFHLEAIRLEELRQAAVELELRAAVEMGELTATIPRLRAALAENPYREHLWALLMKALVADGRRGEAIVEYAGYVETIRGLGLDPSAETVKIVSEILGIPTGAYHGGATGT